MKWYNWAAHSITHLYESVDDEACVSVIDIIVRSHLPKQKEYGEQSKSVSWIETSHHKASNFMV
jgi:hypothetical protein